MSFAKAVLSGILASDPEKRFTPNTNAAVTNFTLLIYKGNDQEPVQVKVACWRGLADTAADQLKKGDAVLVDGKLMINSFQTPEGVQKKNFEIEAISLHKLSGLPQSLMPSTQGNASTASYKENASSPASTVSSSHAPTPDYSSSFANVGAPASAPATNPMGASDFFTEDDIPF